MAELGPCEDELVRSGKFAYDGKLVGTVFVYKTSRRPGSGDHEDEPEWRDDQCGTFYEIRYELQSAALTSRAGGGWHASLSEAIAHVEKSVEKVFWDKA